MPKVLVATCLSHYPLSILTTPLRLKAHAEDTRSIWFSKIAVPQHVNCRAVPTKPKCAVDRGVLHLSESMGRSNAMISVGWYMSFIV
jgi:hypothetical protein